MQRIEQLIEYAKNSPEQFKNVDSFLSELKDLDELNLSKKLKDRIIDDIFYVIKSNWFYKLKNVLKNDIVI